MLKITNLTQSFVGCDMPILSNIDLELAAGEFCILIGSNGSGKSTLLRCISGELSNQSGKIEIDGPIATVVQEVNQGTCGAMTVLENLVLSYVTTQSAKMTFYTAYASIIKQKIQSLGLGLEKYLHQTMSKLSGGQRQTLATVMAMISQPKIVLLDEHTSALDPHTQQTLMEYTAQAIQTQEITGLMITHKLEDALRYGNRLIMLHEGRIVLDVKGAAKAALTMEYLLSQFYQRGQI